MNTSGRELGSDEESFGEINQVFWLKRILGFSEPEEHDLAAR
jgi:hypothetical protein